MSDISPNKDISKVSSGKSALPVEVESTNEKNLENIDKAEGSKKTTFIIVALVILFFSVSGTFAFYALNNRDAGDKGEPTLQDKEENDSIYSEKEEDEGVVDDVDTSSNSGAGTNAGTNISGGGSNDDMTALWSSYHNSEWGFGLKYPRDMVYRENPITATSDEIVFGVGSFDVFTIYLEEDVSILDHQIETFLVNQCSDSVEFSTISYANFSFRKGREVPNSECLNMFGIVRERDLTAYGYKWPQGNAFVLRNEADEGLNEEQLDALLGSVYFE